MAAGKIRRNTASNGADFFAVSKSGDISCRCQYPNENYYEGSGQGRNLSESYVSVDNIVILPNNISACQNVTYICPGESIPGTEWNYNCSSIVGGMRKRNLLRTQRELEGLMRTQSGLSAFHAIIEGQGSSTAVFVILPKNNPQCNTTTWQSTVSLSSLSVSSRSNSAVLQSAISLSEVPSQAPTSSSSTSCTKRKVNFDKADNGRPLAGGTFVHTDWLHKHGFRVTAQSGSALNMHPRLFDTANPGSNGIGGNHNSQLGSPNVGCSPSGPGVGGGGSPGAIGENCRPLRNVLIASTRRGDGMDSGKLIFEFDAMVVTLHDISLLNIKGAGNVIEIHGQGGVVEQKNISSVGTNGLQTLALNLPGVTKFVLDVKSFSAIAGFSYCSQI